MIYEGIDFANIQNNVGRCYVADNGHELHVLPVVPDPNIKLTRRAVDCPLGVSSGFTDLIQGHLPSDDGEDGYKTRKTERWLREYAAQYRTNQLWRERGEADRAQFPRPSYFNGGAHVQSAAGLQIVPDCIAWLYRELRELAHNAEAGQRLAAAGDARRGEGMIIEAHPRMFLYSAVERLYNHNSALIAIGDLNDIAGYKEKEPGAVGRRQRIYGLLKNNTAWMGQAPRDLLPAEPPEELVNSDHKFDAWLAALTAWAHHNDETLDWKTAGIAANQVSVEGHILVLR